MAIQIVGGSGSVEVRTVNAGNLGASYELDLLSDPEVRLFGTLNANCALITTGWVSGTSRAELIVTNVGGFALSIDGMNVTIPTGAGDTTTIVLDSPDGGSTIHATVPDTVAGDTDIAALNSLLVQTFDLDHHIQSTQLAGGYAFFQKVPLPRSVDIANFAVYVTGGGNTLTSGQNLAAIYKTDGTLIAKTASQHTAWTTTGLKVMALTAESRQSLTQGGEDVSVYLVMLAVGTTRPSMYELDGQGVAAFTNMNLSTPNLRVGTWGNGSATSLASTMPAQVTGNQKWWMGLTDSSVAATS